MKKFSIPNRLKGISCIYKFYDSDNQLLYVGKTIDLANRLSQHRCYLEEEEWKDDVVRITYIPEDNDCNLEIYETYLINTLRPKYNKDKVYKNSPNFTLDIGEEIELDLEVSDYIETRGSFLDIAFKYDIGVISKEDACKLQPKLREFINELGKDRLKANSYHITKLTKELDNVRKLRELITPENYTFSNEFQCLIYQGVLKPLVDDFYTCTDIKAAIQSIYDKYEITEKGKARDIERLLPITKFKIKFKTKYYKSKYFKTYQIILLDKPNLSS